jgi:ribosomal protein L37AE/L43A
MSALSAYRARQSRDAAFFRAEEHSPSRAWLHGLETLLDDALADYAASRTPAKRDKVRRLVRKLRGARACWHATTLALYARASGVPECQHCGHRASHPCATPADSAVCMMMDGPVPAMAAE